MKQLVLAVGLILAAGAVFAGPIEYGLKGGICLSSQDFDLTSGNEFATSQRIGPEFGFFVEFYPPKAFSITASLMLTERGMKSDLVLDSIGKVDAQIIKTTSENNHINYISAMVAFKKSFELSNSSLYLILGPRLDFRYGAGGHDAITAVYDDSKGMVAGVSGGLGWEIRLKRLKRLFFEMIYNYDLSEAYSGTELTIKNRSLSVLVGLKI
jgi:hypothetical protein